MDLEKSYKCGVITVSPVIMEARKKKSNIPILFNEQQEKKNIKIIKKNQDLLHQYIVYTLKFRMVLAAETWCQKRGLIKEIAWFQAALLPTVRSAVPGQRKPLVQQEAI